jgi:hypothetical protein
MCRPSWILTALALLATGCDRGPAPSSTAEGPTIKSAPATASTSATCDAAHAKSLEQELLAQCAISEHVLTADVPAAPWKPAPSAAPLDALRLELGPAGVVIAWGAPAPLADLPARLAEERDRVLSTAATLGRPAPTGWVLAIAGTTPRTDVATLLQALADVDLPRGHLLLATNPPAPLPVPRDPKRLAELATRIDDTDLAMKAVVLAKEIEQTVSPCPALAEGFSTVATIAPESRCQVLARSISEGLVSCGCRDEDTLMTLMYAMMVGLEPPVRLGAAVPTTLDPTAPARPGATWADVVAGLDDAAPARLWVSPS